MAWPNGLTVRELEMLCVAFYHGDGLVGYGDLRDSNGQLLEAYRRLEQLNLVEDFHATPRGQAYIAAIMALPLPEIRWVIPTQEAR